MHKKFIELRISDLPVFLNDARLICHAKAPDRRTSVNRPPSRGLRAPGFGGGGPHGKQRPGEWRSRHPGSRLGGGGGISALALFRYRLGGFGRPARLRGSSAKGRRSLPARERRSGTGLRVSFYGSFRGGRSLSGPASASGACGGTCLRAGLAACTRGRRRRLRMLVCPNSSSGGAAPPRGHRSSRGRRRIARFGATARGYGDFLPAAFARPSRPRLMRRRVVPCPGHEAAGILPLRPAPLSLFGIRFGQ